MYDGWFLIDFFKENNFLFFVFFFCFFCFFFCACFDVLKVWFDR